MISDFRLAYRDEFRGRVAEPAGQPPVSNAAALERPLELTVLFTGFSNTERALASAARMASGLDAHIRLIVPQIVPYPLALESPPVLLEFSERRFQALSEKQQVSANVEIFLCRDREVLLHQILPANATVVIGGRNRWWPTAEKRLARGLHRRGYETIFVGENPQGELAHA